MIPKSSRVYFSGFLCLAFVIGAAVQPAPAADGQARMRQLLNLTDKKPEIEVEILQTGVSEGLTIEDLRFREKDGEWIPAMVVSPKSTNRPLPAILCLPGTGGTRRQLSDSRLQMEKKPRTGWARALAKQGFLTLSIDYHGSKERGQNIVTGAIKEQLEGGSYMAVLVREALLSVDYLQARQDVDSSRVGITGFSLGGVVSWYAAMADSRIKVVVPVCGGVGSYRELLKNQNYAVYHTQYFYPAGFLKYFPGDQAEVFACLAPRPVLILGRDQDQAMPVKALRGLEKQVKAVYLEQQNGADLFEVFVTPGDHAFTVEMLERVKGWFRRYL